MSIILCNFPYNSYYQNVPNEIRGEKKHDTSFVYKTKNSGLCISPINSTADFPVSVRNALIKHYQQKKRKINSSNNDHGSCNENFFMYF